MPTGRSVSRRNAYVAAANRVGRRAAGAITQRLARAAKFAGNRAGSLVLGARRMYNMYTAGQNLYNQIKFKGKRTRKRLPARLITGYRKRALPGNVAGGYVKTNFKPYKKKIDRNSVILRSEQGGIVKDPDCVYVGHGVPILEAINLMLRSVLKQAFQEAGIEVQNLEKDVVIDSGDTGFTHVLVTDYFNGAVNKQWINFQTTLTAGWTLIQVADAWFANMSLSFAADLSDGNVPIFSRIRYIATNTTAGTEKKLVFNKNLDFVKMSFEHTSYFKMQNITLPGTTTASTGEDPAVSTNVEAVTLHGRAYKSSEWTNNMKSVRRTFGSAGTAGFYVRDEGIILETALQLKPTGEDRFKKPPAAWEVGSKVYSKVVINPGKIYRDKLRFVTTISFNKAMEKLCDAIKTADTETKDHEFGLVHLFALEKMLDFRTGDSPVEVGYEVDWTMKCRANYKIPPTSAQIKASSAPINLG